MAIKKITRLLQVAAFLCLISMSSSEFPVIPFPPAPALALRPLCFTQFSLVYYACSSIPYSPILPPSPPPPPPPPLNSPIAEGPCPPTDGHRRRHHHRHKHSSSHNPAVDECCRWLKALDAQCVCDLLVRLPVFLAKPVHAYTVDVNSNCNVTYRCPSRVFVS
ncbi:hypothetical protein RND81_01G074100 [Saponaria officinalis]|uniref:Bifunctional inhibitor/plant lipid transfer protein/seed storage helical domain-containing protein n=1 Tax=Saponaria officinalis TaxID=3572 RepID=A0AAW1NDC9_SAPOF